MRHFGGLSIFDPIGFYTVIGAKIGLVFGIISPFLISTLTKCSFGIIANCNVYLADNLSRLIMLPLVILFGDVVNYSIYWFFGYGKSFYFFIVIYYFLIGYFLGYLYGKFKK